MAASYREAWGPRTVADGSREERVGDLGGEPNGICLDADGRVIVANITGGSVQRLDPATGRHDVLATEASGRKTTSPNSPFVDGQGGSGSRTAPTAPRSSTRSWSRPATDSSSASATGGARSWPTTCGSRTASPSMRASASSTWRRRPRDRVTRFPIRGDGSLGAREQYGPDLGTAPDGIAFDEAGNLWVVLPILNGLGLVTPSGGWEIVVEDPASQVMKLPTNLCFGGPDRRTVYVGNLSRPYLPTFRVEVPGLALVHQR